MHLIWSPGLKCLPYVTSSEKTCLTEEQKEQALIKHPTICAVSDQSLDFLSLMNIYSFHFSCSMCSFNHKCYHKRVKTTTLG